MFLLHINSHDKVFGKSAPRIKQQNFLKVKFKKQIKFLNLLKTNKKTKDLSLIFKNKIKSGSPLKYVLGISLSNTNTNVYVTDVKGKIKYLSSAGFLGLSGNQKIKKPAVLIKLLQLTIKKTEFMGNLPIALHLKNFTESYVSLILSIVSKYFNIKHIRVYNNKPYNGCRPKKIKRKKRRKKFF